ncbi:MAG: conserved phage C-terminal domain-containing protein [Myxococcales bacterium]|nr:conserved phage C-terminal domain-containing protein [Myxococcales bacterium]
MVAFLMTSHVRQTVPGLVVIGKAGLAEAMGAPVRDVGKALDELEAAGLVELDEAAPLLCLVPAPEWDGPPHTKAVMAWRRQLEAMPASPLVARHVARLRAASTLKCPSDVLETALAGFGTDNVNDAADIGRVSEGYPKAIPLRCTDSDSDSDSDKDSDTDTDPAAVAARVFSYWRSNLWKKVSDRDPKQNEERAKPIKARLADGYTEADLMRVVDAVARSPFHLGKNDNSKPHIEPELIFRKSKIDGWLNAKPSPATVQGGTFDVDAAKGRAEQWMSEEEDKENHR